MSIPMRTVITFESEPRHCNLPNLPPGSYDVEVGQHRQAGRLLVHYMPINPLPDGGYVGCDVCTCPQGYCQANDHLRELRQTRLWHWREMMRYAKRMSEWQKRKDVGQIFHVDKNINAARKMHNIHMRALQALNDLFDIGDTAEKDHLQWKQAK